MMLHHFESRQHRKSKPHHSRTSLIASKYPVILRWNSSSYFHPLLTNRSEMAHLSNFRYSPLDPARSEIRLLQIQPANDLSSELVCNLVHSFLDECLEYDALSYTWDGDASQKVLLDGHHFFVSENLETALMTLRDRRVVTTVWVDAICMNQNDKKELSMEVPKMLSVYKTARRVLVWLGGASEDSGLAFDHLEHLASEWTLRISRSRFIVHSRQILSILISAAQFAWILILQVLPRFRMFHLSMAMYYLNFMGIRERKVASWGASSYNISVVVQSTIITFRLWWNAKPWLREQNRPEADDDTIKAIAHLFKRPWFTRTWIVQELIGARQGVFLCGTRSLSIDRLSDAIDMIGFLIDSHESRSPYLDCQYQQFSYFRGILFAKNLNPALKPISEQRQSLLYLMNQFSHLDATNARDKVYGFLGLATENITPDYTKPVSEVYTETARTLIEENGNLDVLRACLFTGSVADLPSWAPDWTVKEARSVSGFAYWRDPYALDGHFREPIASFSPDRRQMSVRGIVVAALEGKPEVYVSTRVDPDSPYIGLLRFAHKLGSMAWQLIFDPLLFHLPGRRLLFSYLVDRDLWKCGYLFKYILLGHDIPGHIQVPRTMEASSAYAGGRPTMHVWTWHFTPRSASGEIIKGRNKWKNIANTWAEGSRADDLIVMLLGAKVPFLVRKVHGEDDGGREMKDHDIEQPGGYHGGSKGDGNVNSNKYRLVGPITFGGTIADTWVWETAKERWSQSELPLETFTLV
ncbi:heterokaryon incompatibility protein-domain-containing protein [Hypoxylon sp. FL1150]|nr:heterokaryon incompatibility protein-domain-containing protein [Hypoxylon sp. FL1150]